MHPTQPGHIDRVQEAGALTVVSLLPELYAAHGGASVDVTCNFTPLSHMGTWLHAGQIRPLLILPPPCIKSTSDKDCALL